MDTENGRVAQRGRPGVKGRARVSLTKWPTTADGAPSEADGTLFGSGRPTLRGRQYALRQQTVRSSAADGPLFKLLSNYRILNVYVSFTCICCLVQPPFMSVEL